MRFKSRFWLVIVTATMGMIAYPATDCLAQSSTSGKDNGQTTQRDNPVAEVPILAEASGEASNAIKGFKKPEGWLCELFAAEPMTGNPVAFTIDGKGRVFICESYRQGIGVTDNRSHDAVCSGSNSKIMRARTTSFDYCWTPMATTSRMNQRFLRQGSMHLKMEQAQECWCEVERFTTRTYQTFGS